MRRIAFWALVLASWWAVWAWHPQDEPPSHLVHGPFRTRADCEEWVRDNPLQPTGGWLDFLGCLELPIPEL